MGKGFSTKMKKIIQKQKTVQQTEWGLKKHSHVLPLITSPVTLSYSYVAI